MNGKRYGVLALVLMVGLLVVGFAAMGCGGTTEETAAPSASASGGASQADNQAAAEAAYAGMTDVPTFAAPGPAFDAKAAMAGKSILSIPGTGTDPFYVQIETGMKQAAEAVGYPFSTWNNQGQLTQYQQGFQNGITKKVNLIDLLAGPGPQLPEAADRRGAGRRDQGRGVAPHRFRADSTVRGLQPAAGLHEGRPGACRLDHRP